MLEVFMNFSNDSIFHRNNKKKYSIVTVGVQNEVHFGIKHPTNKWL